MGWVGFPVDGGDSLLTVSQRQTLSYILCFVSCGRDWLCQPALVGSANRGRQRELARLLLPVGSPCTGFSRGFGPTTALTLAASVPSRSSS